ncbi:MAG: plasmid recombination protein [Paludibacter sp.]|nr:plasmid recombination protein [Paludibacter sp.]
MGYAVLHLEKTSGTDAGMSAHIERTISPKNSDPLRTHLNKELVQFPKGVSNRTHAIQYRLESAGLTRKIGKNQVRAIRILLTGSPDDMKKIESSERLDDWCRDNMEWLRKTYGKENVVSAVLHMDETTPHIHATVVPITTGERRKAKQEQSTTKKKYHKKSIDNVRLCADDVMSRVKLKEYQNSYSQAMTKYGLQRGIDGSEAKHVSTSQYYRELLSQTESVQENIGNLLQQQERVIQELSKIRSEIKTEKFKSTAVNVATSAIEGISSVFDNSKVKKQQQEIEKLKTENRNLNHEVEQLNEHGHTLKTEYTKTTDKLREELRKIYDLFPNIRDILNIEKLCKTVGFSEELTQKILTMKPVGFKGRVYSPEYQREFETDHSIAKIEKDSAEPNRLRLFVDNLEITEWFKKKYQEFQKDLGINPKLKQGEDRGFKI